MSWQSSAKWINIFTNIIYGQRWKQTEGLYVDTFMLSKHNNCVNEDASTEDDYFTITRLTILLCSLTSNYYFEEMSKSQR